MCIYFCQAERLFLVLQITGVFFFWTNLYDYIEILHCIEKWKSNNLCVKIAEWRAWKRAGPITQRSVDGNHALLNLFHFLVIAMHIPICIRNNYFGFCYFNMCIYFCQVER